MLVLEGEEGPVAAFVLFLSLSLPTSDHQPTGRWTEVPSSFFRRLLVLGALGERERSRETPSSPSPALHNYPLFPSGGGG